MLGKTSDTITYLRHYTLSLFTLIWNAQIVAEFPATGGEAAQFGDALLVIVHTTGARSGELREIRLIPAFRIARAT